MSRLYFLDVKEGSDWLITSVRHNLYVLHKQIGDLTVRELKSEVKMQTN